MTAGERPSFAGARPPFAESPVQAVVGSRNLTSEEFGGTVMMTRNAAATAAELMALASASAAALVVWLLLARPLDVVDAVGSHELGGLARLLFTTMQGLLMRLLQLL